MNKVDKEHLIKSGSPGVYKIKVLYGELPDTEWKIKAIVDEYAENPYDALMNAMRKYPNEVYEFDESHFPKSNAP